MGIYSPYSPVDVSKPTTLTPRKEQETAVKDTFNYFEKSKEFNPEYLWNAKMRFGKTVSALWLIERLHKEKGLKKVLIITHRPVVNASWYDDFKKVFKGSLDDYAYGTSKETEDERDDFNTIKKKAKEGKCVIFFASIHYLRLSKAVEGAGRGDDEAKNAILDYDWDLVIIDEAHEGTQTNLGANVINYLRKGHTKFLNLSGTPFNLLENFKAGQIYNWDYIQEQEAKRNWNPKNGDNPYITLPEMEIFTFRMGDMTDQTVGLNPATGKFSFSEFFRVKEGQTYPAEERGKFLHEAQVIRFLEKLCEKSDTTHYPFSTSEYRKAFRHTLWVVPGVKEAAALKDLIESDAVPALKKFKVINVAGQGDADEQRSDALDKVLKGMGVEEIQEKDAAGNVIRTLKKDDSDNRRTITLSCGRLTTGVTVAPWTAVLYLKGSDATSASTYMQTIFRVQSPHVHKGQMKSKCYVFDFAPERALTMMAETAKYYNAFEKKATKKKGSQKAIVDKEDKEKMAKLLAVCPVYEMSDGAPIFIGGEMKPIDAERLFSQLNEVYVDKVVRNGFDHPSLYNYENLENPSEEDMKLIEFIGGLWKPDHSTTQDGKGKVQVNDLTEEQKAKLKEEAEARKKAAKKAREEAEKKEAEKLAAMSEEEREKYLRDIEEKARKKELIKQNRSKLEGLSKRIPLMMFGANIGDIKDRVTIDMFADESFIDNESWAEFMPKEVSREMFLQLAKFYNPDIFRDAGMRIRELAQEADNMSVEDRIQRIAQIFKFFKNPDKETVLTPWEVVNRHMSDTLGGYCFFDTDFKSPNKETIKKEDGTEEVVETSTPRFVPQGEVTKEIFGDGSLGNIDEAEGRINTKVLEINSKTGLYPLYVTYSLYKHLLPVYAKHKLFDDIDNLSVSEQQAVWDEVVANNIYVICNTPMAVRITRRTLLGFRPESFDDGREKTHIKNIQLIKDAQDDREGLVKKLRSSGFWADDDSTDEMKFNAVVGNPPYQINVGVKKENFAVPVYHHFVNLGKKLGEPYSSLITPSRWFTGGRGLDEFRTEMLQDHSLYSLYDYIMSTDLFPSVDIAGGISYYLYDQSYKGKCKFTYNSPRGISEDWRTLNEFDVFVRDNKAVEIVRQVKSFGCKTMESMVSTQTPFGLITSFKGAAKPFDGSLPVLGSFGTVTYAKKDLITRNQSWVDKFKVIFSVASAEHAGQPDKNGQFRLLTSLQILPPKMVCTQTFLVCGTFDNEAAAKNCVKYLQSKFLRFLVVHAMTAQHIGADKFQFVPFQDFESNKDLDWDEKEKSIDEQLYSNFKLSQPEIDFIESTIKPL